MSEQVIGIAADKCPTRAGGVEMVGSDARSGLDKRPKLGPNVRGSDKCPEAMQTKSWLGHYSRPSDLIFKPSATGQMSNARTNVQRSDKCPTLRTNVQGKTYTKSWLGARLALVRPDFRLSARGQMSGASDKCPSRWPNVQAPAKCLALGQMTRTGKWEASFLASARRWWPFGAVKTPCGPKCIPGPIRASRA
jgi:hypothetical protein